MSNIYIKTYGCSSNQAESEIMAGLLQKAGYDIVENIVNADLIIVNTCWVKQVSEQRLMFYLKDMQNKYPDKKLIISGCAPEAAYKEIVDTAPDASLVSTHHITKITQAVQKTFGGKRIEFLGESKEVKLCLPRIRKNPIIDIVEISEGCNGNCTYCATRLAKGKIFSFPSEKIIEEISLSVKNGCKEIWITAQDTACYGLDDGIKLPELLNEITNIPRKFFVRVGMMNPNNVLPILPDLISAFRSEKVYKFLHLPVQSGDNEILRNMSRRYKIEDFEEIVKAFKENFRIQLWTDIIVGYPNETREQFENTLELIKRVMPDWVNVSKFGSRPDTEASKLKLLPSSIVKERSRIASELVRAVSLEKNKEWIGWVGTVLISEKGKKAGQWIGRNFTYKPILVESKENLFGKLLDVKVVDTTHSHLMGSLR
jgi:MiaB-like tRNA modifying enzyme